MLGEGDAACCDEHGARLAAAHRVPGDGQLTVDRRFERDHIAVASEELTDAGLFSVWHQRTQQLS
jgi:hypothetical protein